ncbi:hypothetical protein [Aeromonas cavernicola]|uniref:Uncharacterized protein n=1 Tax=Aeromonas cavernicola TaxID=1006623 RepID=A0A2H9U5C0_9GAMM|nr:hypothetical protein [Aeromonas cavernicola]PJG59217.1 hypothetical protein CUC53_08400 [Aeromonas cavernicola]
MKERLSSRKLMHIALVLSVLLSLFAYRTWFWTEKNLPRDIRKDQKCDLSHGTCMTMVADKALLTTVVNLPIKPEHEFFLHLKGGDPNIKPKQAWLEGRDMFMGRIPIVFESVAEGWQGRGVVGSCTSPLMVWLLNIEWSNGEKQQVALSVRQ